jgi:hypothetical protein
MTNILRFARQGFLGDVTWEQSWGGIIAMASLLILTFIFAMTGIKKFDQ